MLTKRMQWRRSVTKIGREVTRFFRENWKAKKKITFRYLQMNYRSLQMNYRSLQMNWRYLQTVQYIPIIYIQLKKVQKEVKIATLWRDHLILWGGCKFCPDSSDRVGVGVKMMVHKGGRREFSTWLLKFLCRLPVCTYSIYLNGVAACSNFIWLLIRL